MYIYTLFETKRLETIHLNKRSSVKYWHFKKKRLRQLKSLSLSLSLFSPEIYGYFVKFLTCLSGRQVTYPWHLGELSRPPGRPLVHRNQKIKTFVYLQIHVYIDDLFSSSLYTLHFTLWPRDVGAHDSSICFLAGVASLLTIWNIRLENCTNLLTCMQINWIVLLSQKKVYTSWKL